MSEAAGQAASELVQRAEEYSWQSTRVSRFLIRHIGTRPCGGDEVVKDLHHSGWGLDVREVPDAGEHFKPATRHGGVSGVAVGDGDDPVLIAPNQQDR